MESISNKNVGIQFRAINFPLASVGKALFYLSICLSFLGPSLLVFRLGPVSLVPFRMALLGIIGVIVAGLLLGQDASIKLARPSFLLLSFLVAWLVWAGITVPFAIDTTRALQSTGYLAVGMLFVVLALYYVTTVERLKVVVVIWAFTCLALLPIAIYENRTGNHLPVSGVYGSSNPNVMFIPTATYRNPNDFATAITLTLPLFFLLTFASSTRLRNSVWPLAAALSVYIVFLTKSRANILAVMIEIVAMTMLFALKPRNGKRALFAATAVAAVAISILLFPVTLKTAFNAVATDLATQLQQPESSTSIRVSLIRNSFHFLALTGGLGVGAGNAESWMQDRAIFQTYGILNPHNWWVEILVEFGVVIFALYLLFWCGMLWSLLTIAFSKRKAADVALFLSVSLIGFPIAAISSSSILALPVHWLLYATCLACVNLSFLEDTRST